MLHAFNAGPQTNKRESRRTQQKIKPRVPQPIVANHPMNTGSCHTQLKAARAQGLIISDADKAIRKHSVGHIAHGSGACSIVSETNKILPKRVTRSTDQALPSLCTYYCQRVGQHKSMKERVDLIHAACNSQLRATESVTGRSRTTVSCNVSAFDRLY